MVQVRGLFVNRCIAALLLSLLIQVPQTHAEQIIELLPEDTHSTDCWLPCEMMPFLQKAEDVAKFTNEQTKRASDQLVPSKGQEPSSIAEKFYDLLDRVNIRYGLGKGFDLTKDEFVFNGQIRYQRRLSPSYLKNYTTLTDDYLFETGVQYNTLADITKEVKTGTNFGATARQQYRFIFAQQHPGNTWQDHLKIAIEKYYTPLTHTPYSAKQALTKMKEGDFFAFQAPLSLVVSASQFSSLTNRIPVSASAYYAITGEFIVHLFRLSPTKYRIKFFAIREKTLGFSAAIGYAPMDDKYFKVSILDREVRRRLKIAPLEYTMAHPKANLAMVDYIIDLTDQRVAKAFNDVAKTAFRPRPVKIMNPMRSKDELKTALLVDIAPFNDIYDEEKDKKDVGSRSVERMFQGTNDTENAYVPGFRVGIKDIAQISMNENFAENRIIAVDRNNNTRYFYMPTFTKVFSTEALFGLFDAQTTAASNLLVETDQDGRAQYFGELSFQLDHRDRKFRASEIKIHRDHIRKRIPESVFNQIPWGEWLANNDRTNARLTSLLVFRPPALKAIEKNIGENGNKNAVKDKFLYYLSSLPTIISEPDTTCLPYDIPIRRIKGPDGKYRENLEDKFFCEVQLVNSHLVISLDENRPFEERVSSFLALRPSALWQEVGPGFLLSLIGDGNLEEKIFFETVWNARGIDTLHFTFGNCRNRRLYRAVNYIYRLLYDRNIDLRLIDNPDDANLPELDGDEKQECQ